MKIAVTPTLTVLSNNSAEQPKVGAEYVRAVDLFFKSYLRKPDADHPEVFVAAWMHVVSQYPIDLVRAVLDPAGALRTSSRFIPDISELAAAFRAERMRIFLREEDERRAANAAEHAAYYARELAARQRASAERAERWQRVAARLEARLPTKLAHEAGRLGVISEANGVVVLATSAPIVQRWFSEVRDELIAAWREELPNVSDVRIVVCR
jgi:hypothetical protein